jgi:diguanylate cyclase (GGDEF)-like protein/PAS domain S-box-containing protein
MTWSPELSRIYGLDPARPLPAFAEFLSTMVAPADRERVADVTRAALREGAGADFDMTIVRSDGEARTLHSRVRAVTAGAGGEVVSVEGISQDVTELRAADRARRAAEERFEVAFDRAPIGMFLADTSGRFLRVNAALSVILGRARDDLIAVGPAGVVHPGDLDLVEEGLASVADGDVAVEHRMRRPDGGEVWVAVNATLIRDEAGAPLHVLGQMQDVTERRRYEERLRHLADHDPLTGLLNRRGFERALDAHVARTRRYGAAGALLVVDLDGFKDVNDSRGHHAGDELLVACAAALRERLRETDVVARLGGDEFAVLLPVESAGQAAVVAAALAAVVRERGAQVGVTASIGVAAVDPAVTTGDELLVRADRAMYAAKAAGRDGVALDGAAAPGPGADARP